MHECNEKLSLDCEKLVIRKSVECFVVWSSTISGFDTKQSTFKEAGAVNKGTLQTCVCSINMPAIHHFVCLEQAESSKLGKKLSADFLCVTGHRKIQRDHIRCRRPVWAGDTV